MSHINSYNTKLTTFSHTAPVNHRPSPRQSGADKSLGGDLFSLIPTKDAHKKPPNKHKHHHLGASPKPIKSKGNKKGSGSNGSGEEMEEGSLDASSQDDEDADDEEDNDDNDDESAVKGPARLKPRSKRNFATKAETQSYHVGVNGKITAVETVSRVGLKRSYDLTSAIGIEDGGVTETDDEPNYPRKKIARRLSNANGLITYSVAKDKTTETSNGSENRVIGASGNNDSDDDNDGDIDHEADEDTLFDEDEEEILKEEEEVLIREAARGESSGSGAVYTDDDIASMFPDLPSDADFDWDLNTFNPLGNSVNTNEDLFSVPASREESLASTASDDIAPHTDLTTLFSEGWSEFDETECDKTSPFFEKDDPAVKHIMNTKWDDNASWIDDSGDEDQELVNLLLSDGESSDSVSESGSSRAANEGEEASGEDDDSDATDLDENLPLPTPRKDSKLRPLPSSSQSAQILYRDPSSGNGPLLGSWIADADRPICIIEGNRKTIILPPPAKRFSYDSEGSISSSQFLMVEEDEQRFGSLVRSQESNINQPSNPNYLLMEGQPLDMEFDEFLKQEYDNGAVEDDGPDCTEQVLSIDDLIEFSTSDDDGQALGQISDVNATPVGSRYSKFLRGHESEAEAALTRWDIVSVTAFRKRQQLHKQRLADQAPSHCRGRNPLKRPPAADATMTPARRRKFRPSRIRSPSIRAKKRVTRTEEQWNLKLSPLFEGL